MLMPKRVKYRKQMRGRMKGKASRGVDVNFGDYGLKALDCGYMTARQIEAARRAKAMVAKMDELGFGNCTNTGACESECPKSISIEHIARLNREFLKAKLKD